MIDKKSFDKTLKNIRNVLKKVQPEDIKRTDFSVFLSPGVVIVRTLVKPKLANPDPGHFWEDSDDKHFYKYSIYGNILEIKINFKYPSYTYENYSKILEDILKDFGC